MTNRSSVIRKIKKRETNHDAWFLNRPITCSKNEISFYVRRFWMLLKFFIMQVQASGQF